MTHTIHETISADFVEQVKVSAVYLEAEGEFLFLRKVSPEPMKGKWGVVGGKVEEGEDITDAAVRELKEEAGLSVCRHALKYLKPVFITNAIYSFGFYIHVLKMDKKPEVTLSDEHDQYGWFTADQVRELPHMPGGLVPFEHVIRYRRADKAPKAVISSYLILMKDGKVCLGQRQNTSYMDGYYGLISGHVESGEAASEAMVREAEEEAGIKINPNDLKTAHIMHRASSDRFNIDVFFSCDTFEGDVVNKEPKKCAGWEFFELSHLPENLVDYVRQAIEAYTAGQSYSEWGFDRVVK